MKMCEGVGAIAIDMESYPIAMVAKKHHAELSICRAIVDTSHQSLPSSVLKAQSENGDLHHSKLIWQLIKNPQDIKHLLKLQRSFKKAQESLILL